MDEHVEFALTQRWAKFVVRAHGEWNVAWLIRKVFLVDVFDCPKCDGRMKWMDACTEERDINRVMAKHGLAPRAPPLSPWVSFDQLSFPF